MSFSIKHNVGRTERSAVPAARREVSNSHRMYCRSCVAVLLDPAYGADLAYM